MTDPKGPCVLALGFFDGVHRGHAALLRQAVLVSEREGIPSAVMTFDTHPDTLVRGEPVELINSAPDRAWLIRHYFHIDRVEFFRFTEDTMRTPWRTFLDTIRSELGAVHFVVGYDFRFGWRGEGTAALLRNYCRENALGCDIIDPVVLDGITVSSTYIRGLLKAGNMREAERFMGHPHILSDMVRHGRALGRKLGAPTVNMRFAPGVLIPRYFSITAEISTDVRSFSSLSSISATRSPFLRWMSSPLRYPPTRNGREAYWRHIYEPFYTKRKEYRQRRSCPCFRLRGAADG